MDRLETMRIFVAVAEERGFSAAARRLGASAPAVTRAVSALEERIGTRLLERTTRTVRLTEAGERFLADSRRILAELDEAEAAAGGLHAEPRGQLGITASVNFGRAFVTPVVLEFLARHPEVTVRTLFVDRIVDLVEEGLDVAVRIAILPDSSLTAVRVGMVRRVLCASPGYLGRHGRPKRPGDIARHETISFTNGTHEPEWSFLVNGKRESVAPKARLVVNSADVAIAAAVEGRGLTRLMSYQAAPEIHAGRLKVVLREFEPEPFPVHVVYAAGRRAPAKVRAFVDLAVERLRSAVLS